MYTKFVSVETRFPEWTNARYVMERFIPKRITFIATDAETLGVDYSWSNEILDQTPDMYYPELLNRMQKFEMLLLGDEQLQSELAQIRSVSYRHTAIALCNSKIEASDRGREFRGEAGNIEYIKHELGIAMSNRCQCISEVAEFRQS